MAEAGVPDESCQNYEATVIIWRNTGIHPPFLAGKLSEIRAKQGDGKECTPMNICRTCAPKIGQSFSHPHLILTTLVMLTHPHLILTSFPPHPHHLRNPHLTLT